MKLKFLKMKNSITLIFLLAMIASCQGNESKDSLAATKEQQTKLKRYEVTSGIVHYTSTISGKVLGSTISGSGTEDLYFKDWGAIELVEEKSTKTTHTNIFGKKKTEVTHSHTMSKLNNGESYSVDFDKKVIFLRRDMAMDMAKAFQPNADAGKVGKSMLESIGGKKIGTEKILGYTCDVWDVNGAKQWMYKGVVLKLKITVMGITTLKEATSAKFNTTVAQSHFKLPDFKIQKEEGFLDNQTYDDEMKKTDAQMEKMSKMSFEEWKKMALKDKEDEEIQNMSEEELRQTYNMIQKVIKMRKGN